MSEINLLYIVEGGHVGGAEQILLTIIKAIDKAQYKVTVCLLRSSDVLEDELKGLGIPVFVLNFAGKWDIVSIFRLAGFMRQEKIDIVHSSLYISNTYGRIAAILARVPIIITWMHGLVSSIRVPNRQHKIDKILARFTDCIVACSEIVKESIIDKESIPAYKIRVVHNCVDLAQFDASFDASMIRRQLGIGMDEILIGNVAALDNEQKGQEYLIKAMPEIIKIYPKAKLLLVGEGPSKTFIVQLADSLNITDKVILTGFRRDIPEIMNALDIYVSPSSCEALSISILEAMASKKPVVATHVGDTPALVIENETGYMVPPKDANSIASVVISMLANREKMRQMGKAGFKRVKARFTSELIIKEIEALYKEFLWKIHPRFQ